MLLRHLASIISASPAMKSRCSLKVTAGSASWNSQLLYQRRRAGWLLRRPDPNRFSGNLGDRTNSRWTDDGCSGTIRPSLWWTCFIWSGTWNRAVARVNPYFTATRVACELIKFQSIERCYYGILIGIPVVLSVLVFLRIMTTFPINSCLKINTFVIFPVATPFATCLPATRPPNHRIRCLIALWNDTLVFWSVTPISPTTLSVSAFQNPFTFSHDLNKVLHITIFWSATAMAKVGLLHKNNMIKDGKRGKELQGLG